MTAGEKARLDSAVEHVGRIVDRLSPDRASPFLRDMKVLQNELKAVPEKPDTCAQKFGEQLGSAVSGLVGENATVNVYVIVNGK